MTEKKIPNIRLIAAWLMTRDTPTRIANKK
jgi:hypothetical protein